MQKLTKREEGDVNIYFESKTAYLSISCIITIEASSGS